MERTALQQTQDEQYLREAKRYKRGAAWTVMDSGGQFAVVLVVEDTPGYREVQWFDRERDADAFALRLNEARGNSEEGVRDLVASSMRAQNEQEPLKRELEDLQEEYDEFQEQANREDARMAAMLAEAHRELRDVKEFAERMRQQAHKGRTSVPSGKFRGVVE